MLTGQQFPVLWTSLALIVLLPLGVFIVLGQPLEFDYPELKGFNFQGGMVMQPEFLALLLGLSIYTASFIAEIVRAGIQGVSKGQKEAALAIGLSNGQSLRLVVIPQAMRIIIPPLTSQFLNLTKNSSLAVAIGYPDLVSVWSGTVLNQTGQAVEVILVTMCVFLTHQSDRVGVHELVQQAHGPRGAVERWSPAPTLTLPRLSARRDRRSAPSAGCERTCSRRGRTRCSPWLGFSLPTRR